MLFDNDFNFLNILNIDNNINKEDSLEDPTIGFVKGNMMKNLYTPYKDYKPKIPKTTCEKSALLYKIMELNFVINDLNLWLDLNKNDKYLFDKFKMYTKKLAEYENEYVNKYGPIELSENLLSENMWLGNYPWEGDDSIYV